MARGSPSGPTALDPEPHLNFGCDSEERLWPPVLASAPWRHHRSHGENRIARAATSSPRPRDGGCSVGIAPPTRVRLGRAPRAVSGVVQQNLGVVAVGVHPTAEHVHNVLAVIVDSGHALAVEVVIHDPRHGAPFVGDAVEDVLAISPIAVDGERLIASEDLTCREPWRGCHAPIFASGTDNAALAVAGHRRPIAALCSAVALRVRPAGGLRLTLDAERRGRPGMASAQSNAGRASLATGPRLRGS